MFIVIGIMLIGISVGYLLHTKKLTILPQLTMILIWLLLFILGLEVGHNKMLMQSLHTLGLEALLLAVAGASGSAIAARLLWIYLNHHKKEVDQ
ncbi:LysO family transporter [uncultured Phocaeicola sp.]|jgi:uncharacterized membrane protein YbjE (DUF340 family)|uniref:LysO family transporter n=1 Tax=uncultured Phocaeicola sp. TaxID=990718 RepID=UPI0015AA52BF|nr:LysO family transporter [uncultured Phocaeicola sp.]